MRWIRRLLGFMLWLLGATIIFEIILHDGNLEKATLWGLVTIVAYRYANEGTK